MEQNKVNAPLTSAAKPRRRWRPAAERKAALEARRKQLEKRKRQVEARIAALDPRDRIAAQKRETRANIVLGAVLRAHMELNPSFADNLSEILCLNIRRPADRQLLGSVLGIPKLIDSQTSARLPLRERKSFAQIAKDITKPHATEL